MSSEFSYSKLAVGEIRLLQALPGKGENNGLIRCRIKHFALSQAPRYWALSYAWQEGNADCKGSQAPTVSIELNMCPFQVQYNLWSALDYIQSTQEKTFWVDAICINQSDLEERGQQVLRMQEIFTKAETILVWLGEERSDSDTAISFIQQVSDKFNSPNAPKWLHESILGRSFDRQWLSVHSLFQRKWWVRTWVIQEVADAQDVILVCGTKQFSWLDLSRFSKILSDSFRDVSIALRDILGFQLLYESLGGLESLIYIRKRRLQKVSLELMVLLLNTQRAATSEELDKVYGILALASDARELVPNPSYQISIQQLFADITRNYITQKKSLNILSLASKRKLISNLPSWTPDFSSGEVYFILNHAIDTKIDRSRELWYDAGKETVTEATIDRQTSSIKCKGLIVDEIDGLSMCAWGKTIQEKQDRQPQRVLIAYGDGCPVMAAIWRTLCGDMQMLPSEEKVQAPAESGALFIEQCLLCDKAVGERDGFVPGKGTQYREGLISDFEKWYQNNRSFKIAGRTFRDWVREAAVTYKAPRLFEPTDVISFEQTLAYISWERRLTSTVDGLLGMVPAATKIGDKVCVLHGCNVPVILRQAGQSFEFIGECYIHGIMYGEILPEVTTKKYYVQDLIIV